MHKSVLLLLVFYSTAFMAAGQHEAHYLLMSWNIRLDTPHDGPNAWSERKAAFCSHLRAEGSDIFGFQEVLHHQLVDLQHCLDGYVYVGVGRADGKTRGEYSPIFFKKDRFRLISSGTNWLSETPDLPGSVGWDAALERIVSWAEIIDTKSGDTLLIMNTHFDHVGQKAREQSANLIVELSKKLTSGKPLIVMGDLNATPENVVYQRFIDSGLADTRRATHSPEASTATYTGFDTDPGNDALIDFILHSAHFEALEYRVQQVNSGGRFLSDHLPVVAKLHSKHR